MNYIIPPIETICTHASISLTDVLSSQPLDAIKTYGAIAECTDFSLLHLSCPFVDDYGKNDKRISSRYWITAKKKENNTATSTAPRYIAGMGNQISNCHEIRFLPLYPNNSGMGLRPMLHPDITKYILPIDIYPENGRKTDKITNKGHVEIATYGYYPQTIADKEISDKLTIALQNGSLKKTGKKYTHITREYTDVPMQTYTYPEYEFEGNKYIRVEALSDGKVECVAFGETIKQQGYLSNGEYYYKKSPYWIKVEPVEWLMDKTGYWMTKKIITGGIPCHLENDFVNDSSDFFAYQYLNSYFKNNLEQNISPSHLLAYKLWLCETLSQMNIPDKRMQYIQCLLQCAQSFSKQYTVNNDLLKGIKTYTHSLVKDYMQSTDLFPKTHFEELTKIIFDEKETTLKTMMKQQTSRVHKSFLSKMISYFQHIRT